VKISLCREEGSVFLASSPTAITSLLRSQTLSGERELGAASFFAAHSPVT
jgi:hypothetical protein